jgi:hypothetical protein
MPYSHERGENHQASLYAKVSKGVTYSNIDQRLLKLAKKDLGEGLIMQSQPFQTETKLTPRVLLTTQAIMEMCWPKKYEYVKEDGVPFDVALVRGMHDALDTLDGEKPIGDLPDKYDNSKMLVAQGSLVKGRDGYDIECAGTSKRHAYGFSLRVDNNSLVRVGKALCEEARNSAVNLIRKNYSEFLKIVEQSSF